MSFYGLMYATLGVGGAGAILYFILKIAGEAAKYKELKRNEEARRKSDATLDEVRHTPRADRDKL